MLPRNHPDRLASATAVSAAEWSSSEFAAFRGVHPAPYVATRGKYVQVADGA